MLEILRVIIRRVEISYVILRRRYKIRKVINKNSLKYRKSKMLEFSLNMMVRKKNISFWDLGIYWRLRDFRVIRIRFVV